MTCLGIYGQVKSETSLASCIFCIFSEQRYLSLETRSMYGAKNKNPPPVETK